MRRVLTQEQIEEAKKLRLSGKTKRELAKIFDVGETTIWENVFSNKKRFRIFYYLKKQPDTRPQCSKCEIKLTRVLKYPSYIPLNYAIEDKCITCYLEEIGKTYKDLYE